MTDPILTFVIALRHPDTTPYYDGVERLLASTLRSLDRQTDRRFRTIVVANHPYRPPSDMVSPVETVRVDFPPPPDWDGEKLAREAGVRIDKGTKNAVALSRVAGGHVMWVDADDFVSVRMVEFVAAHADEVGWFVDEGLRYDVRSGLHARLPRFNEVCGTSLIFRRSQFPAVQVPAGVTTEQMFALFGQDVVLREMGSHRSLRERMNLRPLPFRGAVYCVNNGHNVSRQNAVALGRPTSDAVAAEFGFEPPPRRRAVAALARGSGSVLWQQAGRVRRRISSAVPAGPR